MLPDLAQTLLGAAAPQQEKLETQQISCVPAPDLPLTLTELVTLLELHVQICTADPAFSGSAYRQACSLLSQVVRHDCQALRAQVTSEFRSFDSSSELEPASSAATQSLSDLSGPEQGDDQAFLSHLLSLLLLARYRPLTDAEEDAALRDSFTLTAPLTIQYDKLDDTLLTTFWAGSPQRQAARALLPPSADRLLVLHRGVGKATAEGVYLPDKLNVLLRHMARPLWAAAQRVLDPMYLARLEARLAGVANTEVDGDDKQLVVSCPPLTVERRSLVVLAPSATAVLSQLGAVMGLQEPTFKQVVVLYRNSQQGEAEDDGFKEDLALLLPQVTDYLPMEATYVMDALQSGLDREKQLPTGPAGNQLPQAAAALQQQEGLQTQPQPQPQQQQQQQEEVAGAGEGQGTTGHQSRGFANQARAALAFKIKQSMRRSMKLIKGAADQGEGSSVAPEQQLKLALFGAVPLADLELVLPHKKAYPQPVRVVQLVLTTVTGIAPLLGAAAAAWHTLSTQAPAHVPGITPSTLFVNTFDGVFHTDLDVGQLVGVLLAVSGVLLTRAVQMYYSINRSTLPLLQGMRLLAAKKRLGRQARVIEFTVNQIQQTLTHEMLICWSLLLAAREPMTLEQLSQQAGLLLSAMCGQQVVLPLDTAARRLLRLGLVQVADSPLTDADTSSVLEQPQQAASNGGGSSSAANSGSSNGGSSRQAVPKGDASSTSADWVLLQASPTALSPVPVDQALKILEQQWQARLKLGPTGSVDAAASYAQLKQQLCDAASPELWDWVEQEALVALADMGVTSSLTPAGRRNKRGGSPSGNGTGSSGQNGDRSSAGSPAAAPVATPHPEEALVAASTTTSSSTSTTSSSSSTGSSRGESSWVARAGRGATYPNPARTPKPLTAPRRVGSCTWGRRQAVHRPSLRLMC